MKKIILFVIAIVFFVSCVGVSADENTQEAYHLHHHYQSFSDMVFAPASRLFYETTLQGLSARTTHIVRGRMGDDARISLGFSDHEPPRLSTGSNLVSFEILEVLYGDLVVGDTITLVEPYYIVPFDILEANRFNVEGMDRSGDGVFFTYVNYLPSIPHQEYIFFLTPPFSDDIPGIREELLGGFPVVHGERSRFRIPADTRARVEGFDAVELSLSPYVNFDSYMQLWQEVMDAFVN